MNKLHTIRSVKNSARQVRVALPPSPFSSSSSGDDVRGSEDIVDDVSNEVWAKVVTSLSSPHSSSSDPSTAFKNHDFKIVAFIFN